MTVSAESVGGSGEPRRGRRRWSLDQKRRMVAECEAPGSSVSVVARRHDVNANQLFTWRRQFREPVEAGEDQTTFVPAVIAAEEGIVDRETAGLRAEKAGAECRSARCGTGRMEIVLSSGHRVIVDREVSAKALARVLGALAGQ